MGLTREEAVAHLTGLEGQVTLIVQYKKEGELYFLYYVARLSSEMY